MSIAKVIIHAVWATKNRAPLIHPDWEDILFQNMQEQFEKMGCEVLIINGYTDHVHCLFSMGRKHSISDIIKQVKGESSFYINSLAITGFHFLWQSGYAAFSVNEKNYNRLYKYILNQKVHHENNSMNEIFELPPLRIQLLSVDEI